MKLVLGIDIGGSTTKIVAFSADRKILGTLQVSASDQLTSLFGAIGNLLYKVNRSIQQVEKIVLTGVGASLIDGNVFGIPTYKVNEFEAIGYGGLMLCDLNEALVVSMGTGTAFVWVTQDGTHHLGGSGVGGGSLLGLASKMINENDIEAVVALAENGDLSKIDLSVSDISNEKIPSLPATATASNFGKQTSLATKSDMALGLINMVFQTVGVLSAFACASQSTDTVVLTGSLATLPQAQNMFPRVGALYGLKYIIPPEAAFATAIGAAALCLSNED